MCVTEHSRNMGRFLCRHHASAKGVPLFLLRIISQLKKKGGKDAAKRLIFSDKQTVAGVFCRVCVFSLQTIRNPARTGCRPTCAQASHSAGETPALPFRHSREIPAYAGMTGNPVPRGNDSGGIDMGPQVVIPREAKRRRGIHPLPMRCRLLHCFFRPSGV